MQLNRLKRKSPNKKSRQVGRGGKRGKTSGKGTKGQNARAGRKKRPEERDMIKKLPKMRGRGKNINTSIQIKPKAINLSVIEKVFSSGDTVSPETLILKGVLSKKGGLNQKIKILSQGEISKKLSFVSCLISEGAKKKIESVGGNIS